MYIEYIQYIEHILYITDFNSNICYICGLHICLPQGAGFLICGSPSGLFFFPKKFFLIQFEGLRTDGVKTVQLVKPSEANHICDFGLNKPDLTGPWPFMSFLYPLRFSAVIAMNVNANTYFTLHILDSLTYVNDINPIKPTIIGGNSCQVCIQYVSTWIETKNWICKFFYKGSKTQHFKI